MPPELLQARLAAWKKLSRRQRNAVFDALHQARRDAMRLAAMLNKASEGHVTALGEVLANATAINVLEALPTNDEEDPAKM